MDQLQRTHLASGRMSTEIKDVHGETDRGEGEGLCGCGSNKNWIIDS